MEQTQTVTSEQMRSRIFRFSERRPHVNHAAGADIPAAALAALNPPLYLMLAHVGADAPAGSRPAVVGASGLSVAMLEISPGQKAPLHVHRRSHEAFVCLKGQVKFRWNEQGAEETILDPFDMIDFPVGVYRDFQCVGDEPALLLGIITDEREEEPGDISIAPEERARFAERFGGEILEQLTAATGLLFTDPPGE